MKLQIKTAKKHEIIDITQKVKDYVKDTKEGACLIFPQHTTTSIIINENEERLIEDMKEFLEDLAPKNKNYKHDDTEKRDCPLNEPKNGHAHLKALLSGNSITVPIKDSELQLGSWQSIFLCEFDGPRTRTVILKILH